MAQGRLSSMEPRLGWTQISRAAVQRAEAQLSPESEGVVDELGLLAIHQGYADRFFPGTSVLHTRLRYVLFVAWAYEDTLHHRNPPKDIYKAVRETEWKLGNALKNNTDSWGVIGRRTLPRMPDQLPSSSYWSALAAWGILHRHPDGTVPSRSEVHAHLAGNGQHIELRDDEDQPLERKASPFVKLPPRPKGWAGGGSIDFRLSDDEQAFLRDRFGQINEPGTSRKSLLARLAETRAGSHIQGSDGLLNEAVLGVADGDLPALERADQAASLGAIVRGAYNAMVEDVCVKDGLGQRSVSKENLLKTIDLHGREAQRLSIEGLSADIGHSLKPGLSNVLSETQRWLGSGAGFGSSWLNLVNCYKGQELRRKRARSRLAPSGSSRRKEWWIEVNKKEEIPKPLHYRWPVVVNLLRDLENKGDG